MIQRLEISGVHYKLQPEIKAYVYSKIGKLDRYMDRHSRASAHAEVKLKSAYHKNRHQNICEIILHMPQKTIRLQESATKMPAAVDLAQSRLKNKLKKYKRKHQLRRGRRFLRQLTRQIRSGRR